MNEIWKDIEEYEGLYQVSNLGRVRSFISNKILRFGVNPDGYLFVHLYINKSKKYIGVHRIVASAFLDNYEDLPEVNHIDSDKKNNSVLNLEWVTREQNMKHYYSTETFKKVNLRNSGEGNQNAKLKFNEVQLIKKLRSEYNIKVKTLSWLFNVSVSQIERIIYNKQWNKKEA